MTETSQHEVDLVVRTIAQTAIDNEKYFGDLDSVVGDGDFGYSLARGFEKVIEGWDDFDRTNPGTFLKKVGMVISSRIGGTSGPDLGHCVPAGGHDGGHRGDARRARMRWRCCAPRSRASRRGGSPTSATRPCWTRWSR